MIGEEAELGSPTKPLNPEPLWPLPRWWLWLALLLHVLPFATRPALIGGDEPHYALMAHSLAVDHDVDLADDYAAVERGSTAAGRKRAGQRLDRHLLTTERGEVFGHPLGSPLLAAPFLAIEQVIRPGAAPDLVLGALGLTLTFLALLAGCRLLGLYLGDPRAGAVAGLLAYFASPLWFYSRTFFTEPYTWSLCVLAVAAIVRRRLLLAAVLLAATLATKETSVLVVAPVLAATAATLGARAALRLSLGPLTFGILFVARNMMAGRAPLATFQPFALGNPLAGAAGLLVDPSRGLLWFAPLLVLGAVGWAYRRASPPAIDLAAATAFVAYFGLTAAWVDWRGGSGYGPRLLVPALGALALPLARLVDRARGSRRLRVVLAAAGAVGFTVGWCAALAPVPAFWDATVASLLVRNPAATAVGLAGGGWMAWRLLRGAAAHP